MTKANTATKMMKEAESNRFYRRKYYLKALAIKKLVNLVPVEIQELPISDLGLDEENKALLLTIWQWNCDDAQAVIRILKIAGVIGLKSKYNNLSQTWHMGGGTLRLPQGYTMRVTVYGTEKPPQCEIIETTTTEVVTHYEAICSETGAKVGV